ncbi:MULTISPECIES: motility protein A [Pseudothermotoga]|jgi:chemotaxis protein MotA|uniref:MotA/TolQ/ExbB proton channel n=1 Tax=Pseudothermotoga lettingae (strain ATCC BAA-301 / DSM 14385 / NBRC 107922 / TMO) TaxID=416591 RepID=A8F892_PSELT|nr:MULTISPECIES: motility protein A [Pseudothermotoga]ABV34376.1 MotA/TolQ/ExbB proton channel [Pseudothermotoga lettingae TMO]KUK21039.1 MAG: MotA/TolQ/ExbB proton channel [Pseudothermotoga lettingae]MDI3494379.1 chemotaxis protein MotA [Pseudothermotoga sp.]MDK2883678.1 chemotaxis protein MotA [Pseudothermotoga sp.]GLI48679.1 motility protein A [Pseudothermotoga lettingae TMO]
MDISTILGIFMAFGMIVFGIIANKSSLGVYYNLPSLFITIGGAIASTIASHPKEKSFKIIQVMMSTFKEPKIDNVGLVRTLVSFSEKARREGLLSLEENLNEIEDPFMKKALQLVIDGTDPDLLKNMMETEMDLIEEDLAGEKALMDSAGAYAPAYGMIGTLIGLIAMLKTLNNPETLGPGMSVALITTFYGSILSNAVFLPMGEKIGKRAAKILRQKQMILEGVLSIQAGENPRVLEEKLKSFLTNQEKVVYEAAIQEATA